MYGYRNDIIGLTKLSFISTERRTHCNDKHVGNTVIKQINKHKTVDYKTEEIFLKIFEEEFVKVLCIYTVKSGIILKSEI